MNHQIQQKPCIICGCIDNDQYYSPGGKGPFCGECWEALTDADRLKGEGEALLKHFEILKASGDDKDAKIERPRNEIIVLQRNELYMEELVALAADALGRALAHDHCPDDYLLIRKLRMAAK